MQLIRSNTNRADGIWDSQTGYGTIDMGKTLAAAKVLGGAPVPPDTVPPVLTLKGKAVVELIEGGTYVEPGYSAIDDMDGDITHLVKVSGVAATAYAGEYTLTYTVSDKAGNTSTATRLIIVSPLAEPTVKPPVITQIGSNPIILHLGGSPYVEQGAVAFDDVDGDISSRIVASGQVNTSSAGTYQVKYSITNSAGLSASVTRTVRVLAPKETITRTPYSFSGQGKAGANFNYTVEASAAGIMSLAVSGLSKATILVTVKDSGGGSVFSQTFMGNATHNFWAGEGTCAVAVSILDGNGNIKFDLSLLMPEVIVTTFTEAEIPLDDLPITDIPATGLPNNSSMSMLLCISLCSLLLMTAGVMLRRRPKTNR
jgi:hypothetical protein